jgi:hypothetical protein
MEIEVSIGEIVDKLSILKIKKNNISDDKKLININKEYFYLHHKVFQELNVDESDFNTLYVVNEELWSIEDKIRLKEKNREFDDVFIDLARSVYITNDKRANIKKIINEKYNSTFVEEKSYNPY